MLYLMRKFSTLSELQEKELGTRCGCKLRFSVASHHNCVFKIIIYKHRKEKHMKLDVAEQHSVDLASLSNKSLGVNFIYILSFTHIRSYCFRRPSLLQTCKTIFFWIRGILLYSLTVWSDYLSLCASRTSWARWRRWWGTGHQCSSPTGYPQS